MNPRLVHYCSTIETCAPQVVRDTLTRLDSHPRVFAWIFWGMFLVWVGFAVWIAYDDARAKEKADALEDRETL